MSLIDNIMMILGGKSCAENTWVSLEVPHTAGELCLLVCFIILNPRTHPKPDVLKF